MSENYGDLLAQKVAQRIAAPVASTTALAAIPSDSRVDGQSCIMTADNQDWRFSLSSTATASATCVVPADGLGGRWLAKTGGVARNWTDEWINPAAAAVAGLKAATASTVAVQTVLTAGLLAPGVAALLDFPRNVTFTTAGATAADAPATALITGTDIDDAALTETVTIAQTATIAQGAKCFKTVTSIVYAAGDGTGATVAIGFGQKFGLTKKIKTLGGGVAVINEIAIGARVTTGTFADYTTSPPYGNYSPAAAPDGVNDYAVTYQRF